MLARVALRSCLARGTSTSTAALGARRLAARDSTHAPRRWFSQPGPPKKAEPVSRDEVEALSHAARQANSVVDTERNMFGGNLSFGATLALGIACTGMFFLVRKGEVAAVVSGRGVAVRARRRARANDMEREAAGAARPSSTVVMRDRETATASASPPRVLSLCS